MRFRSLLPVLLLPALLTGCVAAGPGYGGYGPGYGGRYYAPAYVARPSYGWGGGYGHGWAGPGYGRGWAAPAYGRPAWGGGGGGGGWGGRGYVVGPRPHAPRGGGGWRRHG